MKILIIDHQKSGISFRGDLIRSQVESYPIGFLQIEFIPFIYGEKEDNNPPAWNNSMFGRIGLADLYLIHTSNLLAIDLIKCINQLHPDSYIIEYSGGGSEYMVSREPINQNHCIYPKSINNKGEFPNLAAFISALMSYRKNAIDILLGKNKKLILALEFLHKSLNGKPADESILVLENGDEKFELANDIYQEKLLQEWVDNLTGKTGNEYKTALADLRDALLSHAGITREN